MRNDLTIDTSTGALLNVGRVNVGENSLYINGSAISSSSWIGTGAYTTTIGGVTYTVDKIIRNDGNITLVKLSDTHFSMQHIAGSEVIPTKITVGANQLFRAVGVAIPLPDIAPHTDLWARIADIPQYDGYTPIGIIGYVLWGSFCTYCTIAELHMWTSTSIRYSVANPTTDLTATNLSLSVDILYVKTA